MRSVWMKPQILSREKEAEFSRSNKKVKDIHHTNFNDGSSQGSLSRDNQNPQGMPKASFKDKLIGKILGAFTQAFDFHDVMDDNVESNNDEAEGELREGLVAVKLTRDTKMRIGSHGEKPSLLSLLAELLVLAISKPN